MSSVTAETTIRATRRVSVIGCGYLGATHAAVLASHGFEVIGIDIDATKIRTLSEGKVPFHEPGLDTLLASGVASGLLRFSTSIEDVAGCELHFVGVGTPQQPDGSCDTSYVFDAMSALAGVVRPGDVIVGKSTVPVGTADMCATILARSGAHLLWNPEFLREGHAVADSLAPDRIVIGTDGPRNGRSVRTLVSVYAKQLEAGSKLLITDWETAELVKTSANAFLAMKISFINAISEMCASTGADVDELATAIGMDDRIGAKFLKAGLGFGGGCLPKDIRALAHQADGLGSSALTELLGWVDRVNLRARERASQLVEMSCDPGGIVAVLGVAFKPGSDDVRDSPALSLVADLCAKGYLVVSHDPKVPADVIERAGGLAASSVIDACRDAQTIVIATDWEEYMQLDPTTIAETTDAHTIIDLRNCVDRGSRKAAGFEYLALGRS